MTCDAADTQSRLTPGHLTIYTTQWDLSRLRVFVSTPLFNWWRVSLSHCGVVSQVAGKTRRGPMAGRRWPETGSARLSSNTPCWWRRPAARSSPAAWRRTAALTSSVKCRPERSTPRTGLCRHGHPAPLGLTRKHSHTHLKQEAPLPGAQCNCSSHWSLHWISVPQTLWKYLNVSYIKYGLLY